MCQWPSSLKLLKEYYNSISGGGDDKNLISFQHPTPEILSQLVVDGLLTYDDQISNPDDDYAYDFIIIFFWKNGFSIRSHHIYKSKRLLGKIVLILLIKTKSGISVLV